ncbi:hypothetical protein AL073_00925 [Loktanella sp. 1ANDIMAR09]|nr:hypothetical protein AL073_00925 [Loktanella sp. 1ANDIMAR09]
MGSEEIALIWIGCGSFLIPLGLTYLAGLRQSKMTLAAMTFLWAGFTALMSYQLSITGGWDVLLYICMLLFVSAPSAVGGLIGGLVGWARADQARPEEATHAELAGGVDEKGPRP